MAEASLGRKLTYNEVVHHLDGNPLNNTKSNLIVLSRKDHGALHRYIHEEGAKKGEKDFFDGVVDLTFKWLEKEKKNYIKI